MIVRAKICGVRSRSDLTTAVAAGADAIGLISGVTHVAEDSLAPDEARELSKHVPPFVSRVLVTHLEDAEEILGLARYVGVDAIQVHGLVSYETLVRVFEHAEGRRITRAVHVVGPDAVEEAAEVASACDAVQLDSRTAERLGGTGITHDWSISRRIADALRLQGRPVILSGGLTRDNVRDAIVAVRPFAVDVNSGVETATGDKDPELCAAFVSRSREALASSRIDHCVIHVSERSRSNAFYRDVLGAELVGDANDVAMYRFGGQQLNVHGPGLEPEPVARLPVQPGGSDLCFVWPGPIEGAIDHLRSYSVEVELGPVRRGGAQGEGTSVYFRDPDGSLLELISYA